MKKLITLGLATMFVLAASTLFADGTVPVNPCVKPAASDATSMGKYQSCMAEFIKAQKQGIANHQEALGKAEAAMEQATTRDDTGS